MLIHVDLENNGYDVLIERGALARAGEHLHLKRKVLIVTDGGVPRHYAETVASLCEEPFLVTVEQGEQSKSLSVWESLLEKMLHEHFTRFDAVVAVGGGVVGDLAGFAAATYMRGIDFYNIPTTLLSQVDSSVGGKTAVNFRGIKNIVGAFYQPKMVLIDPQTLETLDERQFACGMAEAVKMAACFDEELFRLIENNAPRSVVERIIEGSVKIKAAVVAKDEKEAGLRKALNFGHTIGHAIEANSDLLHGECVALGMLQMCSPEVNVRLQKVLTHCALPIECGVEFAAIREALLHDKKTKGDSIDTVFVEKIGSFELRKMRF